MRIHPVPPIVTNFLALKKVESWLKNSRSVDSLVSSDDEVEDKIKEVEEEEEDEENDLEYFDIFPVMEELGYHEWLFKIVSPLGGLKVFIGNFTYECHFMVLEDTTGVIDHYLGSVVFGKLFVKKNQAHYDKEEGTVLFEKDNKKIIFMMPHKMEMFKHIDFKDLKTDCIPHFVKEGDDDNHEKTHYSDNLNLGSGYKYEGSVSESIRGLMKIKSVRNNKGGVT
nr:retrotransposon Orf1 [Tanacetum cinerariifolium]